MNDIWNGLASFLAEMIEKYGNQLTFDLPKQEIIYLKQPEPEIVYLCFSSYFNKLITK